jgi:E3 ubiquitin-protein ligase BAH
MKFGHQFKQCLRNEGFPPDWVDSAISYSQLKKCINRLTDELRQVGLDPETLSKLLKHVEDYNASAEQNVEQERPFEYILNGTSSQSTHESRRAFHPKLLFYVNETTGEVHSAKMDGETKRKLQLLAVETGISNMRVGDDPASAPNSVASVQQPGAADTTSTLPTNRPGYRTVEVPITSDTEFFTRLTSEVSGLEKLQEREEKRMNVKIEDLGKQVARLTDPSHRSSRKMLAVWRQLFQMYVEEGIFFGTTEIDHKAHNADKAMQRLADFSNKVAQAGLVEKLKKKDNLQALNMFMHINREILQGLRFGEINHSAMIKILKSNFFSRNGIASAWSC